MKTQAEVLLNADVETLKSEATYKIRGEADTLRLFTFNDGSVLQIRKMSGRSAFRANGQFIIQSK